jgi:hypothetical protein
LHLEGIRVVQLPKLKIPYPPKSESSCSITLIAIK